MTYLLLLRHGQSVFNQKNIFTGWIDVTLSPQGIKEAFQQGEIYKKISFDVAFTSTLVRAQTTTFLFLSCQQNQKEGVVMHKKNSISLSEGMIPIFFKEALNERHYGDLQGLNKKEVEDSIGSLKFKEIRRSFRGVPPNGESLMMTKERVMPCFQEEILKELHKGKNVAVVAHGNSLRAMVMEIEKLSEEEIVRFELQTGEAILYHFKDNQFKKINIQNESY